MNNYKPYLTIVDDEPNFSESLRMALEDSFVITTADSIKSARKLLEEKIPDVILLDLRLPDGDGIELSRELKGLDPAPVVIIMTAYATVENAIKALKEGAVDYFTKPLDIEKLKRELNVYLENRLLHKKIRALDWEIKKVIPDFTTSGTGTMKEIVDKVPVVAPLGIPILITGETGTGKEKLARWIHSLSGIKGELVAINCAALPKEILESELFGYTKGAFSGAAAYKEGLIEKAEGGTLFLDEIGELPENVQATFLRVLEDGAYYKLGDTKERKARFRLITATGGDLSNPSSNFRPDLFYRINGFTFELPALRERKQDIPLLVASFIQEADYAYKKEIKALSKRAMERLLEQDWPGNIRELKWCIHRAVAVSPGPIIDADEIIFDTVTARIHAGNKSVDCSLPFKDAMDRLEKEYVQSALASAGNNKTEAAGLLGISVRVLHYKIKKYHL